MSKDKYYTQNALLYLVDTLSILISYVAANFFWLGLVKGYDVVSREELMNDFAIVMISFAFIEFLLGDNNKFIQRKLYEEALYCLKMDLLFAAGYAFLVFIRDGESALASRGVFIFTTVFNMFLMIALHFLLRFYLVRIYKQRKGVTHIFLITIESRAADTIRSMHRNVEWSNRIGAMAVIDKDLIGETIENVPVRATFETMMDYIRQEIVDEVFLDVPYASGKSLHPYILQLEDMGVTVHLSIEILQQYKDFNKSLNMLGDIPVVTFANKFYPLNQLWIKRVIDIAGSLVGILITLVISIFVAPAILIESPGPLIFKQKRVGKNGRYFYIYKFRSMYKDAEARKQALMEKNEMNGLMFKMTDDPRITKVGKFIRKTSIDELPQFFNVLKGDMSLVGTRPPTVDEFKQYEGHHKRRLAMKPGITGMWQVSGRSEIEDFEEVVKLDLEYIDNWTLGLDIKILFKTIGVLFSHKGAK